MGGHMAMSGILNNENIVCAISQDGVDLGARGKGLSVTSTVSNYGATIATHYLCSMAGLVTKPLTKLEKNTVNWI